MIHQLGEGAEYREPHRPFFAGERGGEEGAREAELGGFLEPKAGMADRAQLARKRDLAERDASGGTGRSASAETKAAATARSAAGSVTR